ncbi:Mobile element protein [Corynebacterium glutamicum]|nr:hypothetical protein [Corynebacterium glutamicum]SJM59874.1 Mobile element protein [Corynebacterium glutamicum]
MTRRTLTNWFHDYWFVQVPRNTDRFRVYDQLFIDGTFFNTTCLLVAYTFDHVVAWRWCTKEDAYNYTRLFDQLQPPLIVTTDGQKAHSKPSPRSGRQRKSNAASSTSNATSKNTSP